MKKLLAITVIFALVTGAAFAQVAVGGQLQIGTVVLSGNSDADDVFMGSTMAHEAKAHFTFGDDRGGGKFVMEAGTGRNGSYGQNGFLDTISHGFLWWQPSEFFRMQVGIDADGNFGAAQISGWGFTGEAKNSVSALSDYSDWGSPLALMFPWQSGSRRASAFYPGTGDANNVNMSFFPMDGLRINLVLPMSGSRDILTQFAFTHLNVAYRIEDVGNLNVSFVGAGGLGKDASNTASIGDLYASFYLTALEGMDIDFGVRYGLPWETTGGVENAGYLSLGLGFSFTADDFNIKLRAAAQLTGKTNGADDPTTIHVGILPNIRISNDLIFFFHAGLAMVMPSVGDAVMGWFVNPYIWLRASEGMRFWAGVQVFQQGITTGADPALQFRVPIGFNYYF